MGFELLTKTFNKCGSYLCVGLDIERSLLRGGSKDDIKEFCFEVIDFCNDNRFCYTFKFNYAFFAALGMEGLIALKEIITEKKKDNLMILDCKRADIPNTMTKYVKEAFEVFNADAATFLPFFGKEALLEVESYCSANKLKYYYVVVKPTNPGVKELMETNCNGKELWEVVLEQTTRGLKHCGFVVPPTFESVNKYSELPLLLPGVGKQQYDPTQIIDILSPYHRINVSRGILFPTETTWQKKVEHYYNLLKKA